MIGKVCKIVLAVWLSACFTVVAGLTNHAQAKDGIWLGYGDTVNVNQVISKFDAACLKRAYINMGSFCNGQVHDYPGTSGLVDNYLAEGSLFRSSIPGAKVFGIVNIAMDGCQVDLSELFVRTQVATWVKELYEGGFDGVLLDIEPICSNSFAACTKGRTITDLIDLVTLIRSLTSSRFAIYFTSTHYFKAPNSRNVTAPHSEWYWNSEDFALFNNTDLDGIIHQIYGGSENDPSGAMFYTPWSTDYSQYVQNVLNDILSAATYKVGAFFSWHPAFTDRLAEGLNGIIQSNALQSGNFDGLSIFHIGLETDDLWSTWRQDWTEPSGVCSAPTCSYEDDFSNDSTEDWDFRSWRSSCSVSPSDYAISDGSLQIATSCYLIGVYKGFFESDVTVQADVELLGENTEAGVVVRYYPSPEKQNGYDWAGFTMQHWSSLNTTRLMMKYDGDKGGMSWAQYDISGLPAGPQRLKVTVTGRRIICYLNDEVIYDQNRAIGYLPLSPGQVGIFARGPVKFDNFGAVCGN